MPLRTQEDKDAEIIAKVIFNGMMKEEEGSLPEKLESIEKTAKEINEAMPTEERKRIYDWLLFFIHEEALENGYCPKCYAKMRNVDVDKRSYSNPGYAYGVCDACGYTTD
jgi:hypothetical protein